MRKLRLDNDIANEKMSQHIPLGTIPHIFVILRQVSRSGSIFYLAVFYFHPRY